MAKLTVYIPDELLDRARAQGMTANTSQLVQRGLEQLVGTGSAVYAQRPSDADELLAAARKKLTAGAAADYAAGYRQALATLDESSWPFINALARQNFDLVRWARGWSQLDVEHGFDPPDWWGPLANDLGTLVDPVGFDEFSFSRTHAFVRGYEAALREAWAALEESPPVGNEDEPDRSAPEADV